MHLDHHFTLQRIFEVPRDTLWACWSKPQHLRHFFIPQPHVMKSCDLELKVGGRFNTVFEIGGQDVANQGVVLELVDGYKIVFSDSFFEGWHPNPNPFITIIVRLKALSDERTCCTITARHHVAASQDALAQIDFALGWNIVLDQLANYSRLYYQSQEHYQPAPHALVCLDHQNVIYTI